MVKFVVFDVGGQKTAVRVSYTGDIRAVRSVKRFKGRKVKGGRAYEHCPPSLDIVDDVYWYSDGKVTLSSRSS